MRYYLYKAVLFTGFALMAGTAHSASPLIIQDTWIAEAPPVSKVMAAYSTIKNSSQRTIKIISARSDDFGRIEFHRTVHEDGLAKMRHHPQLTINAGHTLTLEPGGYHMMLFTPARKLKAGDQTEISFQLDDDTQIRVIAEVKKASSVNTHQHH